MAPQSQRPAAPDSSWPAAPPHAPPNTRQAALLLDGAADGAAELAAGDAADGRRTSSWWLVMSLTEPESAQLVRSCGH